MNRTCEQFRELIADLVGGMLDPANRQAVESHLAACSNCRAYRRDIDAEHRLLTAYFGALDAALDRGPDQVASAVEHLTIGPWPRFLGVFADFAASSLARRSIAAALIVVVTAYFIITLTWITQITECIQQSM